jgi:two-component system OmpR family sensor kinase
VSPLFVRIWLTFWAVLAATFVAALAFNYALAVGRARDLERLSPPVLAEAGARALAAKGDDGLRRWLLEEHNRYPELHVLVVDPTGRELTGRTAAEVQAALTGPLGRSPFPAQVQANVAGRPYRFIFQRTRSLAFDLWDILLQPAVLAGLVVAFSGLGSAWLARGLTGPIRRLQTGVRALAAGDLESRTDARVAARADELGVLARDVDHMAGRLRELIAAREAILRDVSHELRAPLARLRATADLARHRDPAVRDDTFVRIDKEVSRLDALIGQILRFSRLEAGPDLAMTLIDLTDLVADVVEDARVEGGESGRAIAFEPTVAIRAMADKDLLRSAIENILRNALRFSPPKEAVSVRLEPEAGWAVLQVCDRGPGVAPADLPRIFDAFHGEGSGAGLGLAITRRIATLHDGDVSAMNRVGGGLTVCLRLPTAARR